MAAVSISQKNVNRLVNETSPYLLQHAHNPVDWYPWSEEAFKVAREQNKPVFLSIGYSTCHWCHVMERESFTDKETAVILNKHFINIKVDREERPDVDVLYMNAVQAMTGSGGWPLSLFLAPDGRPFYGGTYFPPNEGYGRPSLKRVLLTIADAWENKREQLLESAGKIGEILTSLGVQRGKSSLSPKILDKAKSNLENIFDKTNGGFGAAPKFPQPSNLSLLLRYLHRTGDAKALAMVTKTLDAMANGGIYDHIGGGFHRYSTDSQWLVPHFEKMLYDQALIVKVYVEAFQVTRNEGYERIVREISDYVLRDMRAPEGGFFSAEDADSDGREGAFYVWEPKEIEEILGSSDAQVFNEYYGVTDNGNFEHNKSVLNVVTSIESLARRLGKERNEVENILSRGCTKLLSHRSKRPRPHRDDKIITGWNGLMISTLACSGAILNEAKYIEAAEKAADFVLSTLRTSNRLRRYSRDGKVVGLGVLDDYAFMTLGLLDLYEATFNTKWLIAAKNLVNEMIELFADGQTGAFYLTGHDSERLIVRNKPMNDGAIPCGNSTAATALLKLGHLTMERRFTEQAQHLLETFSSQLEQNPVSLSAMLSAVDYFNGPRQEIVIAGDRKREATKEMLSLIHSKFIPNSIVLFHEGNGAHLPIYEIVPFIKDQIAINGRATAYVCQNYACKKPVNDVDALNELILNKA
jgi:uncharacterized protein YyaL (SSP411 family)